MARGSQATRPARPRGRHAPGGGSGARGGALAQTLRSSAPSRYLFAHPNIAAALLFGLFVLVYLWPALVRGELLSPLSVLYGSTPWKAFAPDDVGRYLNPLLSDVPTADYPWRFLVRRMLHEGTFPSWNPYVLGGIPLWSNPQTGLFSIFSLPLWILPLNYGIGVGAALKLWAAGFGSYLLVRELRLGFLPALLAGVCFSFSAINIVWLTHETLPAVAALLPWMLWLVERIYRREGGGRLGSLLGLALATAIGLGGGHPGMQVHLMAAVGMYALLRAAFLPRDVPLGRRLVPFGFAAGGLALGSLLMAFMLVPEALSTHGTVGTAARAHGRGTLPGTQMPFSAIRTVVFPDWWGRPSAIETRGPITRVSARLFVPLNYNERTFYAGTVGLLLALVGVAAGGRWRSKGPFAVLAVLGLAIPLHFPGLWQLITHLPLFEQVQNQRLHFVWAMGMSVLAAFGLEALLERPAGDRRRLGVLVAAGLAGVAGLVAATSERGGATALGDTVVHFVSGKDFPSDAVLAATSVAWFLLLVVGVGVALLAARRWPERRALVAAGIVLLAAFDMLHFAHGYQPMGPASKVIPPRTDAIAFLQKHEAEGRIVGIEEALTNDWALTYGLRDIRGYDPPQPSGRYLRFWRTAESEQLDWTTLTMELVSPAALQVMSVLGARYVVTNPGTELGNGGTGEEALRGLRRAYDGIDARIFSNDRAAPRALVPVRVRVVEGEAGTVATLAESGFDPRREAVVERGAEGTAALAASGVAGAAGGAGAGGSPRAGGSTGRVSVVDRSNADVALHAELDRPGLVVLNDSWAPGWSVQVDGHPAPPVRVNDVMRGVAVPAGAHLVEWRYRVPGLRVGVLLSLVGLLAGLTLGGLAAHRRQRVPG
ncbi:MAG: YfhO family protein [Actinobacteria bacterium]|nr:YfhO family protein [Actinomycetota bacterium]